MWDFFFPPLFVRDDLYTWCDPCRWSSVTCHNVCSCQLHVPGVKANQTFTIVSEQPVKFSFWVPHPQSHLGLQSPPSGLMLAHGLWVATGRSCSSLYRCGGGCCCEYLHTVDFCCLDVCQDPLKTKGFLACLVQFWFLVDFYLHLADT